MKTEAGMMPRTKTADVTACPQQADAIVRAIRALFMLDRKGPLPAGSWRVGLRIGQIWVSNLINCHLPILISHPSEMHNATTAPITDQHRSSQRAGSAG
jgi:hypothetical protein